MINQNSNLKGQKQSYIDEENINLGYLIGVFSRNKLSIISITFLTFFVSLIYAFNRRNVWEGQFEIVLDNSENALARQIPLNQNLARIAGLDLMNNSNSLATEVGILESPSVLKSIYDYVIEEKKKSEPKVKELFFSKWKEKNLKIKLLDKTSILNISYRDTNKSLILPVLDMISSEYQKYSGKSKRRNIEIGKKYLNEQIAIFKDKSSLSIKLAQNYAIDQDLTILDFNKSIDFEVEKIKGNNLVKNKNIFSNIGIENVRVAAANEIRNIDLQIQKIEELDNDFKKIQYLGSTIEGLVEEGLPQTLKEIENQLLELRSKYKEKDRSIQMLKKKRDLLIELLKERSIGYLKAQKITAQSRMEAAMRPKDVIIKYKELMREASRDEETLINLENQIRLMSLEEARLEDPWELISRPTLREKPISPDKFRYGVIGLLLGTLLGYAVAFYKEKQSDFIFEEKILEDNIDANIIEKIIVNENDELSEIFFLDKIFSDLNYENIKLLSIGKIKEENVKTLLDQYEDYPNLKMINNCSEINSSDTIFLLTSIPKVKFNDLAILKRQLLLLEKKIEGIILLYGT